jgi:hypothetical protein
MKYKILPGTPLFDSIQELKRFGIEADKSAEKWIIDFFGEFKKYVMPYGNTWGGISAVVLDQKPEGWRIHGDKWNSCFAPKAVNKKIWAEWAALPCVKDSEIKTLLNYGTYSGVKSGGGMGIIWSTMPGLVIANDYVLVEASEIAKAYTPVDGMVEILGSEFLELSRIAH